MQEVEVKNELDNIPRVEIAEKNQPHVNSIPKPRLSENKEKKVSNFEKEMMDLL